MDMKAKKNMILIAGAAIVIIAIVAIAGCTSSGAPATTNTPTSNAPTATAKATPVPNGTVVRWGIIPGSDTAQTVTTKYQPMVDYLNQATGYNWQVFVGTDYTSVITAMQTKHIEVGTYGPLSYAMAADTAGAQAFAQGLNKAGDLYYHSTIVATPATAQALGFTGNFTPLQGQDGLATLKTKLDAHKGQYTMAYVDPASTSGYGVFRGTASLVSLDPSTEFSKTAFLGGHPAVLLSVAKGTSDLGVCSDSQLTLSIAAGTVKQGQAITIWVSDPIPNSPVAYRSDLPQDEKDKIKAAFLACPQSIMLNATGSYSFRAADDSIYAPVHDLATALNKLTT